MSRPGAGAGEREESNHWSSLRSASVSHPPPITLPPATMACSAADCLETYKVQHFLRSKCSKILAELFAKELKNCGFIKRELEKGEDDTLSKSLFRILKSVSSKGKKEAQKKGDRATEEPGSASQTLHINNLNINKDVLSSIQVRQLLVLEEGGMDAAVEELSKLDSAFLLWLLTNGILDFPLSLEVEEALKVLIGVRNSIHHRDNYKNSNKNLQEMLHNLCTKTRFLYKYLGKDDSWFQNCVSDVQNSFSPALREVQEEIHASLRKEILRSHPHSEHTLQPTIKHLRGYCQQDEIVESLTKFMAESQVGVGEEPRPILLCGSPRAGKSFILQELALAVMCEEQCSSGSFPLVVMVNEIESRNMSKEIFWEKLFLHLADLCPQAVKKHGLGDVVNLLSCYSTRSRFLFLLDQNLQNTNSLDPLMPLMDHGTWVLSCQGVPDSSTFYRVLKIEPLSEWQVYQLLRGLALSEEKCSQVSRLYWRCDYKGLIDTPDMVCIFAKVCLEVNGCVPFLKLIQSYVYANVAATDENERKLIKMGEKAFDIISESRKYYSLESLDDQENDMWRPFLEHDQERGFFFKYRVVEDFLAAKYIVEETEAASKLWLRQATLFKRVFEIACEVWREREDGIHTNLPYIRKYLERLFEPLPRKKRKGKKKREEPMDTDEVDDGGCAANNNNFVRWVFLSKLASDNQDNQDFLDLLAELVARQHSWLFKCKSLTEQCIDNLSLVFKRVKLTKPLTIKLESGPNVTLITKLWGMLASHRGVCGNTSVRLVIHHTEKNWIQHEKLLALLPATLARSTAPLYITKYVGPLLCSGTEQFLKCLCMKKLDVLDVYVCDLGSLCEVLEHRQRLKSVIVRLNLRLAEMKIPNTKIRLSSSFPLDLTITYFEGLQSLLDKIEPPRRLTSLRIYRVYIHKNFHLDLTRFTKLEFLSVRFVHVERLPLVYMNDLQSEEKMEVDNAQNDRRVFGLPPEQWALHLVKGLHLPSCLERLLLRNLSFCDDSKVFILSKYLAGLPFQRLVLLDTYLSMSKFKEVLQSLITSDYEMDKISENMKKKCRLEERSESLENAVKQERLERKERESRRKEKPNGKEVIITSNAKPCKDCQLFFCTCVQPSISQSRNTCQDFVTLVNNMYSYRILNISYSSKDVVLRKDLCGDLHVQCPLASLDDETVQRPELAEWCSDRKELQEVSQVLGALALAQAITLTHTHLSHEGALCLLQHLKERKKQFGRIEPFRLTIFSRYYHTHSMSPEEVRHSPFTRMVKNDDNLQQFNFWCDCMTRCHNFKKSIKGMIYFKNDLV